jgi:hypothetical protein
MLRPKWSWMTLEVEIVLIGVTEPLLFDPGPLSFAEATVAKVKPTKTKDATVRMQVFMGFPCCIAALMGSLVFRFLTHPHDGLTEVKEDKSTGHAEAAIRHYRLT